MKKTMKMKDLKKLIREMIEQEMGDERYFNPEAEDEIAGIMDMVSMYRGEQFANDQALKMLKNLSYGAEGLVSDMSSKRASASEMVRKLEQIPALVQKSTIPEERKPAILRAAQRALKIINSPGSNQFSQLSDD